MASASALILASFPRQITYFFLDEGVCEFSLMSVGLEGITFDVSTPGNRVVVVVAVVVDVVLVLF